MTPNRKPYFIRLTWQNGHVSEVGQSHNPSETREYGYCKISRHPRVVKRVEMFDLTGPLEAIFDADWHQG